MGRGGCDGHYFFWNVLFGLLFRKLVLDLGTEVVWLEWLHVSFAFSLTQERKQTYDNLISLTLCFLTWHLDAQSLPA